MQSNQQSVTQEQLRRYRQLMEIHRLVGSERDTNRLPDIIMREVSKLLCVDRSTLFLLDQETMQLCACFAQGVEDNAIVVPLRMGIVGAAILQRKMQNIVNAYQHPYFNSGIDKLTGYKTDSILAAPILDGGGVALGGVELLNKNTGRFSKEDEKNLTAAVQKLAELIQAGGLDAQRAGDEMASLHEKIGFDRCSVFVMDKAGGQLVVLHAEGLENQKISLCVKLGIAGLVTLTNQMLLIPDTACDQRFDSSFDKLTGYHTRNILCIPLHGSNGEVLGAIQAINKLTGDFSEQDVEMLTNIANVISISIENAILLKDSDKQFHSILEVLAASIDARDTLTAGHSVRVAKFATGIGRILGFAETDLDVLHVSAILHDYGKIGIADCVLKKNGSLDAAEFEHMQLHAALTYDILHRIYFARKYRGVPLIASSHHEYLNGSVHGKNFDGGGRIRSVDSRAALSKKYDAGTGAVHSARRRNSQQV
ncbi:MAG: GAF domain-containing protein [Gallionella sp.]|jgi:GAF domain-containing protein